MDSRVLCKDDAHVNNAEDEDARIEHLSVGNPDVVLHAGFVSRLISNIIDFSLLVLAALLLASIFWLLTGDLPAGLSTLSVQPLQFILFWGLYIVMVFAYSVLLVASDGQTIGKQATRIAVVQKDGTTPSLGAAAARWLYSLVSMICLGAGFFAIIRDPEKQAWHDHWANTYVITMDEGTERI